MGLPGGRVARLERTADEVTRLLADPEHAPRPVRDTAPLLTGGSGDRVLKLAARTASVVAFTGARQVPGEPEGTMRLITPALRARADRRRAAGPPGAGEGLGQGDGRAAPRARGTVRPLVLHGPGPPHGGVRAGRRGAERQLTQTGAPARARSGACGEAVGYAPQPSWRRWVKDAHLMGGPGNRDRAIPVYDERNPRRTCQSRPGAVIGTERCERPPMGDPPSCSDGHRARTRSRPDDGWEVRDR